MDCDEAEHGVVVLHRRREHQRHQLRLEGRLERQAREKLGTPFVTFIGWDQLSTGATAPLFAVPLEHVERARELGLVVQPL